MEAAQVQEKVQNITYHNIEEMLSVMRIYIPPTFTWTHKTEKVSVKNRKDEMSSWVSVGRKITKKKHQQELHLFHVPLKKKKKRTQTNKYDQYSRLVELVSIHSNVGCWQDFALIWSSDTLSIWDTALCRKGQTKVAHELAWYQFPAPHHAEKRKLEDQLNVNTCTWSI